MEPYCTVSNREGYCSCNSTILSNFCYIVFWNSWWDLDGISEIETVIYVATLSRYWAVFGLSRCNFLAISSDFMNLQLVSCYAVALALWFWADIFSVTFGLFRLYLCPAFGLFSIRITAVESNQKRGRREATTARHYGPAACHYCCPSFCQCRC